MNKDDAPVRALTMEDRLNNVPVCVVWEITLGCNLGCVHCGSRAGTKRKNELSLPQCYNVIDQLSEMGTREICLIGGEVFVRSDWVALVTYIKLKGLYCVIQTGGYKFPREQLQSAFENGLDGIGVSIDGFEVDHDRLRGRFGSFQSAMALVSWCAQQGYSLSANTQISALSKKYIPRLGRFLQTNGVKFWQLQLTVPMGNASDNFNLCVQPFELESIFEDINEIYEELKDKGLLIIPGNNIGYFGPYETKWRGPERGGYYDGCTAGVNGMGIEADGTIKACPSLPKERYSCGSAQDRSVNDLWHAKETFGWNRDLNNRTYSGYCSECYYRDTCRAGCTWMSDSLFGQPGNNPYCIYRVRELKKRGQRERVEKIEEADNVPFGTGKYRLICQKL